jgi:hypothetical protein
MTSVGVTFRPQSPPDRLRDVALAADMRCNGVNITYDRRSEA